VGELADASRNSMTQVPGSPADYAKLVADETEKWGKVVKLSGATVE